MALLDSEDFEGISDETVLSTVNTNYESVYEATAWHADTARAAVGSVSARLDVTADTGGLGFVFASQTGDVFQRFYVYMDTLPSGHNYLWGAGDGVLNDTELRVNDTTTTLSIRTAFVARDTSTYTMSTGKWVRFDVHIDVGTSVTVDIFDDYQSDTYTERLTTTTSPPSAIDRVQIGFLVGTPTGTGWFDDDLVQTTALPALGGSATPGYFILG